MAKKTNQSKNVAVRRASNMPVNMPGKLSPVGWELPKSLSADDWVKAGMALIQIEGAVQWWLGDWWAFGDHGYGERVAALQEEGGPLAGMNFGTVMNYGTVARAIETSRRREVLSFSHHVEVAPLPVKQQERFLNLAERESLSVAKLRKAVFDYLRGVNRKLAEQTTATIVQARLEFVGLPEFIGLPFEHGWHRRESVIEHCGVALSASTLHGDLDHLRIYVTAASASAFLGAPDGRHGDRREHTWQKPDELARQFVEHSMKPGDLMLDPFAGTGTSHATLLPITGWWEPGCNREGKSVNDDAFAADRSSGWQPGLRETGATLVLGPGDRSRWLKARQSAVRPSLARVPRHRGRRLSRHRLGWSTYEDTSRERSPQGG
jgi:hypothetical protein